MEQSPPPPETDSSKTVGDKRKRPDDEADLKVTHEKYESMPSKLNRPSLISSNERLHDPPKKKKTSKNKKPNPEVIAIRRSIQQCCAKNDLHTALNVFDEAIRDNIKIEAQSFYNLLSLCDGLESRSIHIGTPRAQSPRSNDSTVEGGTTPTSSSPRQPQTLYTQNIELEGTRIEMKIEERRKAAMNIKKRMDALGLPLNETAYTALVKLYCKAGDTEMAERTIDDAERCPQCKPKLRLYSALLICYCESPRNDMLNAVKIWHKMSTLHLRSDESSLSNDASLLPTEIILPTEREYCALIRCATATKDDKVFERCLSEVAEDILVPSLETTHAILQWFRSSNIGTEEKYKDNSTKSVLDQVPLAKSDAQSMGPLRRTSCMEWIISNHCSINTSTGEILSGCLAGRKLKAVSLSEKAWASMMDMNESIVLKGEIFQKTMETNGNSCKKNSSQYAGGGKGKKRVLSSTLIQKRKETWEKFKSFLNREIGKPEINNFHGDHSGYDVVIDGANVGYYKQNYANAPKHVDYDQIDSMVQHFSNRKKKILLVLHERHFDQRLMPNWARPLKEKWTKSGILYCSPTGSNDDWFWMHAALWSGRGAMVVSNDEMRDHHFQWMAYRSFLRWKERHQVRFSFGDWVEEKFDSKIWKRRQVLLTYPEVFSRRVQRLSNDAIVIPLPKQGDLNRFLDGSHYADEKNPKEETYVCIALVHTKDDTHT